MLVVMAFVRVIVVVVVMGLVGHTAMLDMVCALTRHACIGGRARFKLIRLGGHRDRKPNEAPVRAQRVNVRLAQAGAPRREDHDHASRFATRAPHRDDDRRAHARYIYADHRDARVDDRGPPIGVRALHGRTDLA